MIKIEDQLIQEDSIPRKSKNHHDIISEQEFTNLEKDASTDPQEDSPGDSEKDSNEEFMMGMNYQPQTNELAEESDEIRNKDSIIERPNNLVLKPKEPKFRVPTEDMIKSSEQPSPLKDKDRTSSSN